MVVAFALALFAADPSARFDAFLKAHPSFVATMEVSANGRPLGQGTLRIARPHRMRFDLKGKGLDYGVSSTEPAYIEIDRTERTYDERPSIGGFGMYPSRLSPLQSFVPGFLMAQSAAGLLGKAKPTVSKVAGGEEIHVTAQTQSGPIELRLVVGPDGRPSRYSITSQNATRLWRVLTLKDAKPDLAPFRIEPPLGYVPFTLPESPPPLSIGQAAPLRGWRRGGKSIDLGAVQRGKPRLLAVLGDDCAPSRAVRPTLIQLGKTMPVYIIGKGDLADPSGALLKRLSPPGTPMFYLVGGDGKVTKLWLGFDPAKAAFWMADVREAAKG